MLYANTANGELEVRITKIIPMQTSNVDSELASFVPLLFVGELEGTLGLVVTDVSALFVVLGFITADGKAGRVGARATPATPVWLALGVPFRGGSTIAGRLLIDDLTAAISNCAAFWGTVETNPRRGGSTDGWVRFP